MLQKDEIETLVFVDLIMLLIFINKRVTLNSFCRTPNYILFYHNYSLTYSFISKKRVLINVYGYWKRFSNQLCKHNS